MGYSIHIPIIVSNWYLYNVYIMSEEYIKRSIEMGDPSDTIEEVCDRADRLQRYEEDDFLSAWKDWKDDELAGLV